MATHSVLLAAGGLLLSISSRARVWRVDSAGGDKTIVEAGVHAQRRDGVDQSMVQQREMELRIRRAEHHQGPLVLFVGHQNQEKRQKSEPEKSNLVGYSPDAALHFCLRIE